MEVFWSLFSRAASREAWPSVIQIRSESDWICVLILRCTLFMWLILSFRVVEWELLLLAIHSAMLPCIATNSVWKLVCTCVSLDVMSASTSSMRVHRSWNFWSYSMNRLAKESSCLWNTWFMSLICCWREAKDGGVVSDRERSSSLGFSMVRSKSVAGSMGEW